jgi:hypothetical protein
MCEDRMLLHSMCVTSAETEGKRSQDLSRFLAVLTFFLFFFFFFFLDERCLFSRLNSRTDLSVLYAWTLVCRLTDLKPSLPRGNAFTHSAGLSYQQCGTPNPAVQYPLKPRTRNRTSGLLDVLATVRFTPYDSP